MLRSLTLCFCGAVLACAALTAAPAATAWCAGPDWVLLDENKDSRFFYDRTGVTEPSGGVVQVNTRVVYTAEGKADALKILSATKNFNRLYETRYRHDLNCEKEESRLLEARHLDKDGVTLKSTDLASATEWEEIPPYARMGMVLEKVCPDQELPR